MPNRFLLASLLCSVFSPGTHADFPATRPYETIAYQYIETQNPRREIHVAVVDLTSPDVSVRVSPGGEDPDGDGPCLTTLMKPSAIANRDDFVLAVNGDFFSVAKVKDVEGKTSGYVPGLGAWLAGPAVTDGKVWSRAAGHESVMLVIADGNRAFFAEGRDPPAGALQVVAGQPWLIHDGKLVPQNESPFQTTAHPRTAIGISKDEKKLILVVVDGRRNDAAGMPLTDLAKFMESQGAHNAINLDGGGSSEMVLRDPSTGALHVVNQPSDTRERAVANVLGVSIRGAKQSEETVLDRLPPATQPSK